jgi:poly-gamma-glutamate synthesis protein (capsule biosynthesis protein)
MNVLKIACVGDTMCGDSFNLLGSGVASSIDKYGSDFLPAEITDIFSSHDIVVCNVECVLSDIGRKENSLRALHMRGRPLTAAYLAKWGINVAHMANNHILEQGVETAIDTAQQLERAGIRTIGAGKERNFQSGVEPLCMRFSDQTIAIVGACFHTGKYAYKSNLDEVLKTIKAEADKGNLVIVSVHWGDELIDRPSIWQRQTAIQFINAGASLVIGHHPHVVQGIDARDNALIAYSLGNFIFDLDLEETRWSIILSITIEGREIKQWEAIPIIQSKDFRPLLAKSEKKNELEKEIIRRCNLTRQKITDEENYKKKYLLELKTLENKFRHSLWLKIIKSMFRYRLIYWPQILWRPVQRRIGRW